MFVSRASARLADHTAMTASPANCTIRIVPFFVWVFAKYCHLDNVPSKALHYGDKRCEVFVDNSAELFSTIRLLRKLFFEQEARVANSDNLLGELFCQSGESRSIREHHSSAKCFSHCHLDVSYFWRKTRETSSSNGEINHIDSS